MLLRMPCYNLGEFGLRFALQGNLAASLIRSNYWPCILV